MKRFLSSCVRLPRVVICVGVAASPSLAAGKRPSFANLLVPKLLAVVLAAGLAIFAGTAEAAIVSLDAPFTMSDNYGLKYLNFDGTSLTAANSQGANSIRIENANGQINFGVPGFLLGNYATDTTNNTFLTFSQGDFVSAASTTFQSDFMQLPLSSPFYYVLGFYSNAGISSSPTEPNADFITNSNLAWLKMVYSDGNTVRVEEAGINTVAGGPIAVGEFVAPVPEPSTYAMALAGLACGGYSLFRRRRAR